MVRTAEKAALRILKGNWISSVIFILLCYVGMFFLGNVYMSSVHFGEDGLSASLFSFSTADFIRIIPGSFVNSILVFAIIDYVYGITNEEKRFFRPFLYSFKHPSLLYKGFIVTGVIGLLMYFIGIVGGILILSLMINGPAIFIDYGFVTVLLLFALCVWMFLGLSQAMYILYEQPKVGMFRSIRRSFQLTKGHKRSLMGLFALFILWFMVGFIVVIIGITVSLAFYHVTRVEYFKLLNRQHVWKDQQAEWQDIYNTTK
ncbi:DUF975 family protein [Lentibacillus sediminis]|uniref:DUF975 family protein n=1 Tax=Lentibacillus sediminis TaxID=1940529 RepID=UPI000C1BB77C|nr:DUF975 family protein [Lentibacillus sediminis]